MNSLTLNLPMCGMIGFACFVLALFWLASRIARRGLGGVSRVPTDARSWPVIEEAPPPRSQAAPLPRSGHVVRIPSFRRPCPCGGADTLHISPLTATSVCTSCARVLRLAGGEACIIDVIAWHRYSKLLGLPSIGGKS